MSTTIRRRSFLSGAAAAWPEQENIASIADRLVVDDNVEALLRNAQKQLERKNEP